MSVNKLLVCPYDEAHKVKATRMQLHITRCRMNHLNEIKFTCPFNARHVMPYQEKDYHLLHCTDKAPLDRMLAETLDKNNPFKGRTAVPSYSEAVTVKSDEIWDVEVEEHDSGLGYLPIKPRPSGAVVQPPPFLGASGKKQLYQELHQQSDDIDFKSNLNSGSSIPAPIPRQPKQPSEASKFESKEKEREYFPCLGLGRGRAYASKIAANIYSLPTTNNNTAPLRSYSSVVGNTMTNMNFRTGHRNVAAGISFNSLDGLPPLGFGRGTIGKALPHGAGVIGLE